MNDANLNLPQRLPDASRTRPDAIGTPATAIARPYLAECESLRGIAILLVMLFHGHLQSMATHALQPNLLTAFIIAGNTGVTLFFVLSGFLLNLPFLQNQRLRPATFFRNRALRILPMYVPVVIFAGIYRENLAEMVQALLFWNLGIKTLWPFGTVWWSLMVEVQFYLLLPCLYWLARSPRLHWLLYPLFGAGCFLYLLYAGHFSWQPTRFYFIDNPRDSILCLWPVFFLGGVLAWIHVHYKDAIVHYAARSRFFVRGGSDLLLLALVLALATVLLEVSWLGPWRSYASFFDHVLIEGVLWTAIIAAILYLPLKTKLLWSNPLLAFFGLISYSLYLLHSPTMNLGLLYIKEKIPTVLATPKPILVAVLLAIATLGAVLTYTLIEKPALRLKHKTAGRA